MKKELRKAIIAGNWKMNKTPVKTKTLIAELIPLVKEVASQNSGSACEVVICVPFTSLATAVEAVYGSSIKVGAQNVHFEASGAFTGEISAPMLKEIGVEYVIIGHSERRQYFGETDETVNKRTKAALTAGLIPIVCVGELLWEREADITEEVVSRQIKLAFAGISSSDAAKVVIAYEPVWAIGTGKTATAEQAQDACKLIRDRLTALYGKSVADSITVQYGGSMNAVNAAELVAKEDVDGGLIGGASLKAEDFTEIIKAASDGQ
ncbi:MAG: triose-phosphate isomerase [Oscillospiraceae bacterium]|nr:triose-phosphate isomerase [Oscillospiraceae bacterium]